MTEHNKYWRAGVEESRRITNTAFDALLELGSKHDELAAEVERLREALKGMLELDGIDHDSPQVKEAKRALEGSGE